METPESELLPYQKYGPTSIAQKQSVTADRNARRSDGSNKYEGVQQ